MKWFSVFFILLSTKLLAENVIPVPLLTQLTSKEQTNRNKAEEEVYKLIQKVGADVSIPALTKIVQNHSHPQVRSICKKLLKDEVLNKHRKGFLGIKYIPVRISLYSEEVYLIRVNEVVPNTPAEKAGLKFGDLIIAVGGQQIKSKTKSNKLDSTLTSNYFSYLIKKIAPNETVSFTLLRDNAILTKEVTLAEMNFDNDIQKPQVKEIFTRTRKKNENSFFSFWYGENVKNKSLKE